MNQILKIDNKVDKKVDKKIPNVSGLVTKNRL